MLKTYNTEGRHYSVVVMHIKGVCLIAAVFLVIGLVAPPVIVILQTDGTIYKYIIPGTNPAQGSTNVTITITPQDRANYNTTITIALILGAVFVVRFAVTMYYGINHPHPEH